MLPEIMPNLSVRDCPAAWNKPCETEVRVQAEEGANRPVKLSKRYSRHLSNRG